MQEFMVGDVVQRTKSGGAYSGHYKFTVTKVTCLDGAKKQYAVCGEGSLHSFDCLKMVKPVFRPWKPVKDEVIQVTNSENPTFWSTRKFLCMHEGRFVCQTNSDGVTGHQYFGYIFAKPIPIDTTITLANGTKITLSEESYLKMLQGFQEDNSK